MRKNMLITCVTAALVVAACSGCRTREAPQAPDGDVAAVAPPIVEDRPAPADAPLESDAVAKVRQAARDYIREVQPGSKVEGVFTLPYYRNSLYIAGVDVALDGRRRQTIDLLVRLYVRENGTEYWRAEGWGSSRAMELLKERREAGE